MGFIDNYLDENRLDKMSDKHKNNIRKLEKQLSEQLPQGDENPTMDIVLKEHGPQIADLVERASQVLHGGFSFSKFRVVINIGIEVYQLVDQIELDDKVQFGKDLTYFIWKTIDPVEKYFNWLPFKKTIERRLVKWLAGYALDAALDMISAQKQEVSVMANNRIIVRTLP